MQTELYNKCLSEAKFIKSTGYHIDTSLEDITNYLYNEQICKDEREAYIDSKLIDFCDEIVSIEEMDNRELIDIQVSGDNLFYANDILTKNSIGLPQSLDWFIAVTTNEVLMENNQQLIHLLKTRWGAKQSVKPQLVSIDWSKMRYSDVGSTKEVQNAVGNRPEPTKKTKKRETKAIDFD